MQRHSYQAGYSSGSEIISQELVRGLKKCVGFGQHGSAELTLSCLRAMTALYTGKLRGKDLWLIQPYNFGHLYWKFSVNSLSLCRPVSWPYWIISARLTWISARIASGLYLKKKKTILEQFRFNKNCRDSTESSLTPVSLSFTFYFGMVHLLHLRNQY